MIRHILERLSGNGKTAVPVRSTGVAGLYEADAVRQQRNQVEPRYEVDDVPIWGAFFVNRRTYE
jgi:hypothetical protein